ncbi:MAG TPA: rod shape-determining protein MreC [Blastocatellia bacterium]
MSATFVQRRTPWLLALLLLSQVILMSWTARRPDTDQSVLRKWVLTALTPPLKMGNWLLGEVTGTVSGYIALRGAHEENIHLKEEIDRLTQERDEAREKAAEDSRLRAQLGVAALPEYRQVAATVISRDPSVWFKRLIINRGSADGIKPNMPVIAASGVVGRVTEVGMNCALIQVITDRHAGVGAMLQQNGAMGEVRGLDAADCEMKDVGSNVEIQPNEPIVTTGLDGIYPKGITIGTVESVQNDPNAPWLKILVKPAAPVDRLENVIVLLVEPKELKMQETVK